MSSIVKERIVNIVLFYSLQGNRLSCVTHWGASAALDEDDPQKLVYSFETNVLPIWQLAVSQDVLFERIYGYAEVAETCLPGQDQLNAKAGQLGSPAIPSNLAGVFQLRQDDVGSKANGRIFIGGITENQCVDGLISAAAVAGELKDLADALKLTLTNGSSTNFNLVALNKSFAGIPIDPIGYSVTNVTVVRAVATQRRRKTEMQSYS